MDYTPTGEILCAKYRKTYAYKTVKEKMPLLLNKIVGNLEDKNDDIIQNYGMDARRDLVTAIIVLSLLKDEIEFDMPLVPLLSPAVDIPTWNKYLWQQHLSKGETQKWFSSPWLYIECYFYRRIQQTFDCSYALKLFDPFRWQKKEELESKVPNVVMLADSAIQKLESNRETTQIKQEFLRFIKLALWGNQCDLSRPINVSGNIRDSLESVDQLQSHILVDNSEELWKVLSRGRRGSIIVDIVNDNAGYELFCDLCLADFLCTFALANMVRFHLKALPWFISDATMYDLNWLLKVLTEGSEISLNLPKLARRWQEYLESGIWVIKDEYFWTLPHTYNQMKDVDRRLYESFSRSTLVIFKGDINYRKLLGERNWPSTESFDIVLQGFRPTNLATLRTVKSELICGLKFGQAEDLTFTEPSWMLSGMYGVIQFDGRNVL